jgi:acyl-CoA thioesterase-1
VVSGMRLPLNLGLNYSRSFKALYSDVAENNDVYFLEHFLKDVEGYADLNLGDRIHPNKQ